MNTFKEIKSLVQHLNSKRLEGKTIGFVPTMGALHNGHLKLIDASVKGNDITVCSIFINPTQFNNPDDLKKYPRTLENDLLELEKAGCDIVFTPEVSEVYLENRIVSFNFGYLEEIMEGKFRPGHFKGVGLVVAKLFNIVKPHRAYFGKKDLQQLVLIQKLAEELNFDIDIKAIETEREASGLAMSSRNERLSAEERREAIFFYKSLQNAKRMLLEGKNIEEVKNVVFWDFQENKHIALEYFEIVDTHSLREVANIQRGDDVSLCIAGYVGKVRLIDNISLF